MKKIIFGCLILALGIGLVGPILPVRAVATTIKLTNTALDTVKVEITGKENSAVKLSFLPTGASALSTITLGSTNASGSFVNSISSGGYGIPATSPVYATIDGVQSNTILWPAYTSSLALSKTSVQIAVGQNSKITATHTLILAANSLPASIGTALSGSQLTVTGLAAGTGTLVLCGSNVGCASVAVTVGSSEGQNEITLSENSLTLDYRQSAMVNIFGGGNNGYMIKSNTNQTAVNATISGLSNEISLYANNAGTANIQVCSISSESNCTNLYVTALAASENSLSFSYNDFSLAPSVSRTTIVSGGPDNNYYISSNSNSGVATASLYGTTVTVTGGSITGSTVIMVCSASKSSICSNLRVSNNADVMTPSVSVLAFSQNVVSVAKKDTTNVTVSGGNGTGYTVSSNSNSSVATASISGSGNIISLYGSEEGTTIVEVCSVETARVCASVYVIVGPELAEISFSKTPVTVVSGQSVIINITGGTNNNVIYSISDYGVVAASLSNNGHTLVVSGGSKNGSAVVKICDAADSTKNCSDLSVINSGASNTTTTSTVETTNATAQTQQITEEAKVIYGGDLKAILVLNGLARNTEKEANTLTKYLNNLKNDQKNLTAEQINLLNYFITYGTSLTKKLGEGERAGVLGSYKKAFGKLPTTEAEWSDVIKIANGRWPAETSQKALDSAKVEFRKVYLREPDMNDTHDNAAVSVIAYGLRPAARKIEAEKAAIKIFKHIYGHDPVSSLAWDIVRAIAYSGAKR
ncbi:hypothetical protein GYA13_00760 [Candidatus Kuenenbacteria bacterium]|nr:hypothetical protein [Candidatus Kuenenbacteria bacterium]